MALKWQSGCVRIEIQEGQALLPLEDRSARIFIDGIAEGGRSSAVKAEGELVNQLAHLLHACVVLSGGEDEEWFIPNPGHPLHLRRHGRQVEIASYPTFISHSPSWLTDDGLYLVDFGLFVESLSDAVEWIMQEVSPEHAEDDTITVLIAQWERAWQRFSRLVTFRRVSLAFV